jgi:uracil-DNA glycosylase
MRAPGVRRRRTRPPERTSRPSAPSAPDDPWEHLTAEIQQCTRCPLHRTRTQAVVYRGARHPRIVFVGEAPGAEEDRVGLPFVGRAGRRLDAAIATLGLSHQEYGILNLVKCRPPRNVFLASAARTCRPYLDRQLDLLRPQLLVTLGARALEALDPTAPRVLQCAGRPRGSGRVPLFPLVHPAALRSRAMARRWNDDLRALDSWLKTGPPPAMRIPI